MALTPVNITNAGVTESLSAVSASDSFTYPSGTSNVWMEVANASAGSITVTVESEAPVSDGVQEQDKSVAVAAGARAKFRVSQAFRASDNSVGLTFSATASVTAGVFYI